LGDGLDKPGIEGSLWEKILSKVMERIIDAKQILIGQHFQDF